MTGRSLRRWAEAGLLLVALSSFGFWAIASGFSAVLDVSADRRLAEFRPAVSVRPSRLLREGDLVGRIEIPRLNLSAVVLEGVSDPTLRVAAGHIPGAPLPGEGGNAAIAAHRDGLFRKLAGIAPGDRIVVTTAGGKHDYLVSFTSIVRPRDTRLLDPTAEAALTLVTCYPFYFVGAAPQRFVVRAVRAED